MSTRKFKEGDTVQPTDNATNRVKNIFSDHETGEIVGYNGIYYTRQYKVSVNGNRYNMNSRYLEKVKETSNPVSKAKIEERIEEINKEVDELLDKKETLLGKMLFMEDNDLDEFNPRLWRAYQIVQVNKQNLDDIEAAKQIAAIMEGC